MSIKTRTLLLAFLGPFLIVLDATRPLRAQLSPPTVHGARPIGAAPGETVTLHVRGADLAGVQALVFADERVRVEELKAEKSDVLTARVTLPAEIAAGPLLFRVATPKGLSNPGRFLVDRPLPTVAETEPNNAFDKPQDIDGPAAVEGEIRDGNDVDVYAIDMQAGETLVAEVVADRAGSDLDALVAVLDPDGRELAAEDDLFGRDAATFATVPRSGRYLVQVLDANGRNRDGGVESRMWRPYRLVVGRVPLLTSVFPLGGRRGTRTPLHLNGAIVPESLDYLWDIPDNAPIGDHRLTVTLPEGTTNPLTVRIGDAPEWIEPFPEPANDPVRAPIVPVPVAINGRLIALDEGDVDLFRLKPAPGGAGEYVITVLAARLGSPADPVLSVLDDKGGAQVEDDDRLVHDARLVRTIGEDGLVIALRDYFDRGGEAFVYRIEVEPVGGQPWISADLGARTIPRKGSLAIPLTVERHGVEGPLTIQAVGLPEGVTAAPLIVPESARGGILVLSAGEDAPLGPFPLRLDLPEGAVLSFRESWKDREGKVQTSDVSTPATLAIAEPAPLSVTIEPAEIQVPPGGQAEIKVHLDRRTDEAKTARESPPARSGREPRRSRTAPGGDDRRRCRRAHDHPQSQARRRTTKAFPLPPSLVRRSAGTARCRCGAGDAGRTGESTVERSGEQAFCSGCDDRRDFRQEIATIRPMVWVCGVGRIPSGGVLSIPAFALRSC